MKLRCQTKDRTLNIASHKLATFFVLLCSNFWVCVQSIKSLRSLTELRKVSEPALKKSVKKQIYGSPLFVKLECQTEHGTKQNMEHINTNFSYDVCYVMFNVSLSSGFGVDFRTIKSFTKFPKHFSEFQKSKTNLCLTSQNETQMSDKTWNLAKQRTWQNIVFYVLCHATFQVLLRSVFLVCVQSMQKINKMTSPRKQKKQIRITSPCETYMSDKIQKIAKPSPPPFWAVLSPCFCGGGAALPSPSSFLGAAAFPPPLVWYCLLLLLFRLLLSLPSVFGVVLLLLLLLSAVQFSPLTGGGAFFFLPFLCGVLSPLLRGCCAPCSHFGVVLCLPVPAVGCCCFHVLLSTLLLLWVVARSEEL